VSARRRLPGELTKREDVLALAFHVDYWDYIGWKDPFADPVHTRRQRDYSSKLGLRYVFTPQMVVQGASSATGSNQAAVLGLIGRDRGMDRVEVRMSRDASGLVTASLLASPKADVAYIWILLLLALMPQIVIVFTSFAERWGASLFPEKYGLGNYALVFDQLGDPLVNSLILSGGATLLCVVFGTLAAYTAVRKRFFGKWALDATIMLPFVLPGIVTGVAFLTTFNSGPIVLTGTASILLLAYFIRRIAYIFRSVVAAIGQVDIKIEEASTVCGATWGRTMRKVTVPLVAPGILAGGILVFSTLITEMSVTIIIYSAQWKTISIAIFEQLVDDEFLTAAAIGSVAIVMTLVLVFTASKLIGKSMADLFR
jgi:ABC-type Fe3+ transport system permease subunit